VDLFVQGEHEMIAVGTTGSAIAISQNKKTVRCGYLGSAHHRHRGQADMHS
jgi:hypothetical protein